MRDLNKQIFKFLVVGGTAFVIDYGVFYILDTFIGIDYLIANVISFALSVIYNYILSIKWVFNVTKKQTKKDFFVFIILSIIGLLLNSLIMYILVDNIKVNKMISKIIATIIVMVYNFITRKIFIEK